MNCKDVAELLPLLLDAELETDVTIKVETHLASCSTCQQLLAEYSRDQQILQSLPLVAPPSNWRAELLDKVNHTKLRREQPAWRFFVPRLGSLAAALLVVLLATNLYVFPSYLPQSRDNSMQRMRVLAGPEATDVKSSEPGGNPETSMEADPPEEIGIMGSKATSDAADAFTYSAVVSVASPADELQKRWWFWSSGISVVVWLAGAGYYYYRYRRHLREQTEL